MRLADIIAGIVGIVAFIFLALFLWLASTAISGAGLAGPVVKILLKQGHGSGTHLGNGFILTAAHVVTGEKKVKLRLDTGGTQDAEVLWINETYDVALVRASKPEGLGVSPLACRGLVDNEPIVAMGNPAKLDFLTFRGFVSGHAREIGPWKVGVPVDISLIGGMSGGPIYDAENEVVGVIVGHLVIPVGLSGSWVRVGIVVPADVVCMLMGRTA